MFSAAFPLAPFIAFINSLLEIRLDATKYIHFQRRAFPKMAAARGAWQEIFEQLAEWSVLINALVIAMTTDFIPKMVYRFSYSGDGSLNGYVNNSLSFYNISILKYQKNLPIYCRYVCDIVISKALGQKGNIVFQVMSPKGGQTRKHYFLAMFPKGG